MVRCRRGSGAYTIASFGSVRESSTYAADVLNAVNGLIEAAGVWAAGRRADGQEPISIGIVVTTGSVIFGIIGDDKRLEYTILRDCVKISAKIGNHTKVKNVRTLASTEVIECAKERDYEMVQ